MWLNAAPYGSSSCIVNTAFQFFFTLNSILQNFKKKLFFTVLFWLGSDPDPEPDPDPDWAKMLDPDSSQSGSTTLPVSRRKGKQNTIKQNIVSKKIHYELFRKEKPTRMIHCVNHQHGWFKAHISLTGSTGSEHIGTKFKSCRYL
jgi:hypothetical protein